MATNGWQRTTSAFLIGIGVGTGLALLFAPQSGEDTRDQIAGAVKDGVDGVIAKGNKVARRAQKTYEDARDHVKDVAETAEQSYREAKTAAS